MSAVKDGRGDKGSTDQAARAFRMPDALWERVRPLLPPRPNTHRFGGGRPPADDRARMDGIFFVLRTGCQWKALSATGICRGSTAHDRFQRWAAAGVFLAPWRAGLHEYDELVGLDWRWLPMDGAVTKAPLGGGEKPARAPPTAASAGRSGAC